MTADGTTATNPDTGEKVIFRAGKWIPLKDSAPPPGVTSAPPTWFQQYVSKPATSALSQEIPFTTPGGQTAKNIAGAIVPQSLSSAAGDAASLATIPFGGEGVWPALARVGAVGLAGGAGAALEGRSPIGGAAVEAGRQILGEGLSGVTKLAGRYGNKALNQLMTTRMGQKIQSLVPALKNFDLTTPLGFDQAFRSKAGIDASGQARQEVEDQIRQVAGNHLIDMPSLHSNLASGPYRISFDDALSAIRKLDDQSGYRAMDDSQARLAAKTARRMAFGARQDLANGLNQIMPGAGNAFMKAQRQHATATALRELFTSEEGLFPPKGTIDWDRVKTLAENTGDQGFRGKLERAFGSSQAVDDLLGTLGWGQRTTAGNIPGQLGLGASIHGPVPRLSLHPKFPSRLPATPRRFPPLPPGLAAQIPGAVINEESQ